MQRLYREIILWQSLDHPHILPFLGVDQVSFAPLICMVSPWMMNGNLLEYVQNSFCTAEEVNELVSIASMIFINILCW
jgi:serine/threonine protein kinase